MNFFFRLDADNKIGYGHLKRILILIDYTKIQKQKIFIIIRNFNYQSLKLLKDNKIYKIIKINKRHSYIQEALYIKNIINKNDHITFDVSNNYFCKSKKINNYFKIINKKNDFITLIDGLDYNNLHKYAYPFIKNYYLPYFNNLENSTRSNFINYYVGHKYFLFDNNFLNQKKFIEFKKNVKKVFVSFGGSDPKNMTSKIMNFLSESEILNVQFNIIIGPLFSKNLINKIFDIKKKSNINFNIIKSPSNIASHIAKSDMGIISNGHLKYELIYLQIPSIIIPLNNNYARIDKHLKKLNLFSFFRDISFINSEYFKKNFFLLFKNKKLRYEYYKNTKLFFNKHNQNNIKFLYKT